MQAKDREMMFHRQLVAGLRNLEDNVRQHRKNGLVRPNCRVRK